VHTTDGADISASALDALDSFISSARQLTRELNLVLAEDGLREETWRAMRLLANDPGLLMGEIAEALTVSNATVTRLINDLSDNGLAYRKPGDDDGRKAVVYLSRMGTDRLARVNALLQARLRSPADRGWHQVGIDVPQPG
jgi:DNA-binding MarR family transcriptional regulator